MRLIKRRVIRAVPTKGYRSKFEYQVATDLTKRKKPFAYETERFPYLRSTGRTSHYRPDFIISTKSGRKIYVEVKGQLTLENVVKHLLIHKQYKHNLDIRFLFSSKNPKANAVCIEFCNAVGIPYCIETVPEDWFNE